MSVDLAPAAAEVLGTGGPGRRPAGVCLGVATPATGTVLAAAGWARRPDGSVPGEPMTTGTVFDLASVTKVAATTAVAMRLVAAGRLDLDAPVGRHLAGFRTSGDVRVRVTAAHLLAHRSGLPPWWPLYCRTTDRESALDLAERLPLETPPGSRRTYSDVGFMLLGRLVERVTGMGLATAFRQWVAEPLALTRTGFGPVPPATAAVCSDGDRIEAHMVETGRPYPVPFTTADFTGWRTTPVRGAAADCNTAHALAGVSGHAGLFAPLDELLRLASALVHDESFVPAAVRSRFLAVADPRDPEQGLGFRRFTLDTPDGPVPMVGHDGFTGTHVAVATDRPLALALAATRLHGTRTDRAGLLPVDHLAAAAHHGTVRALTPLESP
ncbi:serine hydrolase domain-containing protein [Streptomyces endophyticus]|uniref:Beta-lactamase family protein n=1 Tax=Streptomyces endophyticus TaxID=714166 RepID=A0ABU6F644_9ACTN|nr:serine hydrolase domain-containing protein [Streptomyces endophyticus]MEB8338820.1 beta-lactamase family protein [Streptomyces endophyticus]